MKSVTPPKEHKLRSWPSKNGQPVPTRFFHSTLCPGTIALLITAPLASAATPYLTASSWDTNTENITDSGRVPQIAIVLTGDSETGQTFTNQGSIRLDYPGVTSEDSSRAGGIKNLVYGLNINNEGNISIRAQHSNGVDTGFIWASAIFSMADIENNGTISIETKNFRDIMGTGLMSTSGGGNIYNKGNITLTARAKRGTKALGIVDSEGNINNRGDITVKATSNSTSGYACSQATGIWTRGDVTNSGTINVEAENGGTSAATGIYIGAPSDSSILPVLHSSGLINLTTTRAEESSYQVVAPDGVNITGFAMKFNDQAQVDREYRGTISGGSRDVTFENARLYAFTDNNLSNGSYDIPMLAGGASIDQFSHIQTTSPDYSAELINGNGEAPQKLAITYHPKASVSQLATEVRKTPSPTTALPLPEPTL
ncbi:hypothetical protein [Desulfotalea psychrophila]|uniref:Uncharacterized protein n=1 Tax=Desulfotalea psychrophila (strain LSv54 / DSM 12343) TaxID=177439 RepID=Q6ANV8_DESPS|nr:hypothetical protein [Desulfotalea psychrophila]CAG35966.1 unknown protein [Desulfotalea psychrophila LSv54]